MSEKNTDSAETPHTEASEPARAQDDAHAPPKPARPDPTRYGDWEKNGQCIDF